MSAPEFRPRLKTVQVLDRLRQDVVWDEAAVAELERLWIEGGESPGAIARRWGVSRNTVLGKAMRLFGCGLRGGGEATLKLDRRLNGRKGAAVRWRQPPPPAVPAAAVSPAPAGPVALPRSPAWPPEPDLDFEFPSIILAQTPPKPFGEARHDDCQWPVGGEGTDTLVCGAPAVRRRYCEGHAAVAFRGSPKRRPAPGGDQ